jgi:SAM-dependent methyltransferase
MVGVRGYREDLAYIHDVGHSGYVLRSAPGLLRLLSRHGVRGGLVVDLGCGAGRWARELNGAGYRVLGIDQSPAMIRLARRAAPDSQFRSASFYQVELPACDAVTSLGECLNYRFDGGPNALDRLFRKVNRALRPGGVFIFDCAGPDRMPHQQMRNHWTCGKDWAVLLSTGGNKSANSLQRRILTFRKIGSLYRRAEEVHVLRLYSPQVVSAALERRGFRVQILRTFGRLRLPAGICGFLAVKS